MTDDKDDPTIICNQLVAETSVLTAWKKILKGDGNHPPSVDEGYREPILLNASLWFTFLTAPNQGSRTR